DERLELRDWHQHTGRLDRHIRELRGAVAPETVADQEVGLEVEKFWDNRKETADAATAPIDHFVREIGAAAKCATKAISLEMAPTGIDGHFGDEIGTDIHRVVGIWVEISATGVRGGRRHQRRVRSIEYDGLRGFCREAGRNYPEMLNDSCLRVAQPSEP